MPKKLLYILIVSVLVQSCSSWNNFRAYYNTYYNAKKSFRAGLRKVEKQPLSIDPSQPVLVHPVPALAGGDDFKKAIEKGTQVLQRFSDTKWVDDALLLTGKSYYYRHEFYPALQRFEELQKSASPKMRQLGIIWKGKTLLALERYNDGANFLESQLNRDFGESSINRKAEMQVLAGEHHAMLGHWEQASKWLSQAIAAIKERKLLGRTLFLYGQVLDRAQRYGEAYYAFSKVSENFPGFEYAYWAAVKQADVARKEGNTELAISIYDDLRKDDKNLQRRDELSFHIARTLEMKGETAEAISRYKNLLGNDQRLERNLQADIYYRLGEIYSGKFNNYAIAAAYFDSSSTFSSPSEMAGSLDAQTLANVFGKYTDLKKSINRADSLLWLGALSPVKLDSVIEQIRIRKRRQLLQRREEESAEVLLNRNLQEDNSQTVSSIYGFLNYRNTELVSRAKAEFRIIWGDRPLVDNWRRMEAVRQSSVSGPSPGEMVNFGRSKETVPILDLNLDEIPNTISEKAILQIEKAEAQYELGNLFFLNLNSPDSARIYFHRVVKSPAEEELKAKAMYSLYELFNSRNKTDSLKFWKHQILEKYADTKYAQRIYSKNENYTNLSTNHSSKLVTAYREILASDRPDKASQLRSLALANHSSDLAPHIFYEAIKAYIRQAKALNEMNIFMLILTSTDSLAKPVDLFFSHPESGNYFTSVYWDRVRTAIQEFDTTFSSSALNNKVSELREMLGKTISTQPVSCKRLGVELSLEPSMRAFMSKVKYPEKIQKASLSGKVSYSFVVTSGGKIQSYELTSNRTSLGIEEALEAAFDELKFMPLAIENPPDKIRCEVDFPIKK